MEPTGVSLREGERLYDLQREGLSIIQSDRLYRFGMDAVLLSGYAKAKRGERVVDLCTGSGVVPLLMYSKNPPASYTGVEIHEETAEMAARSVALNGLENAITIIRGDITHPDPALTRESFDVATVNPPYLTEGSGDPGAARHNAAARHEVYCGFRDVAEAANRLLRFGGRFFMVFRPERLTDALYYLRTSSLEPKGIRFVHSFRDKAPSLFLLRAVKGAGPGLVAEPPLVIYEEPGVFTTEASEIYGICRGLQE